MIYDQIRHLADSWGLVFMSVLFVGFIGWTFRKGASERHRDVANSIFREQDNG